MRIFESSRSEPRGRGTAVCAAVLAAALAITACGPSSEGASGDASAGGPASDDEARGRLVIVGGALDDENASVWEAVLEGRDGAGRLCVIPTASGVPERSMQSAVETLDRYGGDGAAMGILITDGDTAVTMDPEMAATLLTCSGYWFTGGSQSRVVETFLPGGEVTPALEAIRMRHAEGAVVAGSSAGAAIMSPVMIAGGSSEEAMQVGLAGATEEDQGVRIMDGLGFFGTGVVDQHFLARGRIGRLLVSVLRHPGIEVGFGIDENTAMVVDGNSAEVMGASGVVIVDGRRSQEGDPLRVTLAGAGDRIDLDALSVTFGSTKRPVEAGPALPASAIFDDWVFLNTLAALAGPSESTASFEAAGGRVTLTEGDGFRAVTSGEGEGIADAPPGLSAGPFEAEITFPGG